MEIHLVSSMTPDDENRLAPTVLAAIGRVLEGLPVSYSVRIETVTGDAIRHNHIAPAEDAGARPAAVVLENPILVS